MVDYFSAHLSAAYINPLLIDFVIPSGLNVDLSRSYMSFNSQINNTTNDTPINARWTFASDGARNFNVPTAALPQLLEPLTEQELNILALIVGGKTNQQIADELVVTLGTVKWHVHNILQKLGVNNRTQATIRALELGLL